MLYILFVLDTILLGLLTILTLIAGIKLYKPVVNWFEHQTQLETQIDQQKNRTREILKNEYLIAKQQDDIKTMKTIIKINKQIKQQEES